MLEAAAAPPPPPPPLWGIISSVPLVFEDEDADPISMSDLSDLCFDLLPPPSISHITLSRRYCQIHPAEATMDTFPHFIAADPLGKFLLYIPGSSELVVCLLPHPGNDGEVLTVPFPPPPLPNLGNIGIISNRGFGGVDGYNICELQIVEGGDSSFLRSYSSESGKWTVSTELQCDEALADDWGRKRGSVISHKKKLWWIDLAYGIVACDPFAEGFLERRRDPFAELQKLQFIPLPGPAPPQEPQDYIDKKRCVHLSNGKLRYVLLRPHEHAPIISMWTLDEPETALWSLQYTVNLLEVRSLPLPEIIPKLALVHPLDPNILYLFKNGSIFALDAQTLKVIHSQEYNMVYPPQEHHCSRFVYPYRLLVAEPVMPIHHKQFLYQDNQNVGIETGVNIVESQRANNKYSYGYAGVFSQSSPVHDQQLPQQGHGIDGTETVGNTLQSHRGKLITPTNFCSGALLSESNVHLFKSAQDLRNSIDANTSKWISNEQGWAMLKNPSIFQVTAVGDVNEENYRGDGSCILADHNLLEKIQPADHAYSTRKKQLIEKLLIRKFSGGIRLCQHTMKGNAWERRRLSIEGDNTFSVIQWRVTAKGTDGEEASRRGCEELAAKGVHTEKLPPSQPDAPRQTPDADAAASNAPGHGKDPEAGLSVDERINQVIAVQHKMMRMMHERMNQLQAGQQKIIQMAEQLSKRLDQVAPVPTPAPSQDSNRDAVERAEGPRR